MKGMDDVVIHDALVIIDIINDISAFRIRMDAHASSPMISIQDPGSYGIPGKSGSGAIPQVPVRN